MSVAISPFDTADGRGSPVRTEGAAEVGFVVKDGQTRLDHLYQRDPARILFPTAAAGDITSAAIVTTSGGLVGGDRVEIQATVGAGAEAQVMAQAAEKVYRSAGPNSVIQVALRASSDSWLEWLPQETILFDGARLDRKTMIYIVPGARLLAGDMLVFGRIARGEKLGTGYIRDAWEVRADGRLVWADILQMDGDMGDALADPARFDGAAAYATVVYAADDAAEQLETARALLIEDDIAVRTAATVVNGLLVVRWLGRDAFRLRHAFGNFWAGFRHAVADLPPRLPRLWHI